MSKLWSLKITWKMKDGEHLFKSLHGKTLQDLVELEKLTLGDQVLMGSFDILATCKNLQDLTIKNCSDITDFQGLQKLFGLQTLKLYECNQIDNLNDFPPMYHLKVLSLDCGAITYISALLGKLLPKLENLYLGGFFLNDCQEFKIGFCPFLKELTIHACSGILKFEDESSSYPNLQILNLQYCHDLKECCVTRSTPVTVNIDFCKLLTKIKINCFKGHAQKTKQ